MSHLHTMYGGGFMISVLIITDCSDDACYINGMSLKDIEDVYVPFLLGMLRYNGISCQDLKLNGFEHEYTIKGKNNDNLIYVPRFIAPQGATNEIDFLYTDSTAPESISFRIASRIRKEREKRSQSQVVFVNSLHENDSFKRFSPIIVDNIKYNKNDEGNMSYSAYSDAILAAKCICEYYIGVFYNPTSILN